MAKNKSVPNTNVEVAPVDEVFDEDETSEDDLESEGNEDMATATTKATARAKKAAEAEDAVDEEDIEEEPVKDPNAFAPYIIHDNQEWDFPDLFTDVSEGEDIILYDLVTERWYKLVQIKVGEVTS